MKKILQNLFYRAFRIRTRAMLIQTIMDHHTALSILEHGFKPISIILPELKFWNPYLKEISFPKIVIGYQDKKKTIGFFSEILAQFNIEHQRAVKGCEFYLSNNLLVK